MGNCCGASVDPGCPSFPPVPKDAASDFSGSVTIIGAGVSGLFAALSLERMGVQNYTVLEASSQIGGRLRATPEDFSEAVGTPLDVGAEWIHGTGDGSNVLQAMLSFGEDAGEAVGGGETKTDGLRASGGSAAGSAKDGMESKGGDEGDDGEGDEEDRFLKYKPDWHFRSSKSRLLTLLYQETKWRRSTWRHWLEEHVYRPVQHRVELDSAVTEVIYGGNDDGRIKLVLASGEIRTADRVICTAPLAVLKRREAAAGGGIKFEPPLPESKLRAIDAVDMPPGFRILFRMKERFYPDLTVDGTMLEQLRDSDDLAMIYDPLLGKDHLPADRHVLAFVAIGHKSAGVLGALDDEDLATAALARIDALFEGRGSANVIGAPIVQNWTREPHCLGAYSFPGPLRHRVELGRAVGEGRVLFAGEHTSHRHYSLVPGAALEGRRAAMEAVAASLSAGATTAKAESKE